MYSPSFWLRSGRWPAALGVALGLLGTAAAAGAEDSTRPIHLRRVATGKPEGLRHGIELSISACRAAKKLPLNAPMKLPSDAYLAKLLVTEKDEYFSGAQYAAYGLARRVAADPATGDCELKVFMQRGAWAGQMCGGQGAGGHTTPLGELTDAANPKPARIVDTGGAMSRSGCGRKAKTYDVAGLPVEDAGAASCVWMADIVARSAKAAGLSATGHKKDSPVADFCLYVRQPLYVHGGHHRQVVLKSSASTDADVMDTVHGENTAYANERLDAFSDGMSIDGAKFSPAAVQAFLAQPVKTPLGDTP
jgi:hypothetical protein